MRFHRSHDEDHHGHSHEPTPDQMLAAIEGRAKAVEAFLGHVEKTAERLKALKIEDEEAVHMAFNMHESEFISLQGHGGH